MSGEIVSLVRANDVLTDDQRKAFANPPLWIKIPAFLFIGVGVASCVKIGVGLMLASNIEFEIGFIGIFVGRGLLRFRNGWRETAILITLFPIGGLIAVVVVFGLLAINHPDLRRDNIPPTTIAISILVLFYSIWQVWCLMDSRYALMCRMVSIEKNAEANRIVGTRKLSLSSLLLAIASLSVTFAWLSEYLHEGLTRQSSSHQTAYTESGRVNLASRHFTNRVLGVDRLEVVMVHSANKSNQPTDVHWNWRRSRNREFEWNGNKFYFPPSDGLCEIRDGTVKFYPTEVRKDELEAFRRQVPPSQWSILALVEFVNVRREDDQ